MQSVAIEGSVRTELGKKATKEIRRADRVPCVIYGGEKNIHFSAPTADFKHLIYTPEFKIAEIKVDGKVVRAVMKDIQAHPVNDAIEHIDFVELVPGQRIKVEVPVKLVGTSAGMKKGGALMQKMRRIKIETTPEHLVDELELDISSLDLGQSGRVRDIKATEGITIMTQPATPVASVEIPRALRSATAKEEATEE